MPMDRKVEKQISQLRQQVYGKSSVSLYTIPAATTTNINNNQGQVRSDALYLKKDLFKISILTFLALGFEFSLYYALQYNLIKLPI